MGRILIPLSGEAFKQSHVASGDTSIRPTSFGPAEAASALQVASVLSGPVVAGASRLGSAISHAGDDAKYQKDLVAWNERKAARARAAEALSMPEPTGMASVGGIPPESMSTDESVAGQVGRVPIERAPKVSAPKEVDFDAEPGRMSTEEDPYFQAARARVQAARAREQAEEMAPVMEDKAPVQAQAANPVPDTPTADTTKMLVPEIEAKKKILESEQAADEAPFKPVHYDDIRKMMLEATLEGDKKKMLEVAQLYRKSNGYGVHPSGVSDLLTGEHIKRADESLLKIIHSAQGKESDLDKLLKMQRITQLQTRNKYADAYEQARNKEQASDAIIKAAQAGDADAVEAAKLLGLQSSSKVKSAEAQFAERKFQAATTVAEAQAEYARIKNDLDEQLALGRITGQDYDNHIKGIEESFRAELLRKRISTMGSPLVTNVYAPVNKFDAGQGSSKAAWYDSGVTKAENELESSSQRMEQAKARLKQAGMPKGVMDFIGDKPGQVLDIRAAGKLSSEQAKSLGEYNAIIEAEGANQKRIKATRDQKIMDGLVYGAGGGQNTSRAILKTVGLSVPPHGIPAPGSAMDGGDGYWYSTASGVLNGKSYTIPIRMAVKNGKVAQDWHAYGEPAVEGGK